MSTTYQVIGTRPIRHDGVDKVTGRAQYGADFQAAGLLHGRIARSPHAHAKIKKIDISKALALPGVEAVVTKGEDPTVATIVIPRGFNRAFTALSAGENWILPIVVGTAVRWPNEDDIFHNVFSTSEGNEFDLGYYKKERVPEMVFAKVGKVDVFCAIHTKMHCIILVLPNPFFAAADEKGRFVIRGLPAGTYRLKGWHERLPAKVVEVTVPADGEVKVDLALGVGGLPKR